MRQLLALTDFIKSFCIPAFIDYLRGVKEAHPLIDKVRKGEISGYISVLTQAELVAGKDLENPNRKGAFWDVLNIFTKLDVNQEIANSAGEIRRRHGISLIDAIIASTAINLQCELLTQNEKDFSKITELMPKKPY